MPNVLIEAMSLGTPVVATSVEGVDEVLGPLAKTEAVSPGNATAFIEAVCRVVRSPELREQLSRENRIRVQREFSLKGMIDSYEQLYLN